MSLKVTRVHSCWTAEQAGDVLSFLDELRDEIWSSYGDQIVAMQLAEQEQAETDKQQGQLDLQGGSINF